MPIPLGMKYGENKFMFVVLISCGCRYGSEGQVEATEKVNLTRKGAKSATICRCSSSFSSLYIDENVCERI